jgi:formylmethanofuran dehydrogenase subunit D
MAEKSDAGMTEAGTGGKEKSLLKGLSFISSHREIETCKVQGSDGYKYEPLWINTVDAATRGIAAGDVVKIHNERGAVLVGAYVTERVVPGAVYIDHGARYDPIVPGELDRGGAINTLTPHNLTSKNATGMVSSGFLAEVEHADMNELKKRYPEAFSRPYHAGAGLCLERVLASKAQGGASWAR